MHLMNSDIDLQSYIFWYRCVNVFYTVFTAAAKLDVIRRRYTFPTHYTESTQAIQQIKEQIKGSSPNLAFYL